jgi:pSer/pThr/pTyr-binding forkhead associated (FHA) protein
VPKLVIFRGDAVESEIRLAGDTVRVGRHNRNDIVLDDGLNGVSRFHAEIRPEGNTYYVVDLNSRNGVWVGGRRVKERATLSLGVPVTIGAFELALEDDVSTTDFRPAASQPTVVGTTSGSGSTIRKSPPNGSGTGSRRPASAGAAARSRVVLWSSAAAALLLICIITFVVFRYRNSGPTEIAEAPPTTTIPEATLPPPPAESPEETARKLNEQDLIEARAMIAAGQQAAALTEHLQPLLERDPENTEALELKRQIEQVQTAAAKPKPQLAPAAPPEPEIAGITRRPNEIYADYQARARRLQATIIDGKNSLDKQDYAAAVTHFRTVDREQPRYQGVDALLADALGRQQKALEDAINNGQQNEQASKWKVARQWYERALDIDPSSTSAKEKRGSVISRATTEASNLYNRATLAVKSQDNQIALRNYQQIMDLLLPGDELWEKARKESEGLKR